MPIIWTYAQLHLLSMYITGLSPWNFATAGTMMNPSVPAGGGVSGSHVQQVTLQELISGVNQPYTTGGYSGASAQIGQTYPGAITQMGANLRRNILPLFGSMVMLRVAKKATVKLGLNRSLNRLSDDVGAGGIIRAS